MAVGAVVPWARAGVGAAATQAMANGSSAAETIEALTKADPDREHRQLGVVDASGNAATFTGDECFEWAGGIAGDGFVAQGNILVNRETVEAMAGRSRGRAGISRIGSSPRSTRGKERAGIRGGGSRRHFWS